jgi:hypothetical protein
LFSSSARRSIKVRCQHPSGEFALPQAFAEALKVLERAGVLSWQNRITRIRERCADLFGGDSQRWRVIRTSNAYVFRDPKAAAAGIPSKSDYRTGTPNQEVSTSLPLVKRAAAPVSEALNKALASLGATLATAREAPAK